jgi:hypothetical protein
MDVTWEARSYIKGLWLLENLLKASKDLNLGRRYYRKKNISNAAKILN